MAKATLPTNYQDDILNVSTEGKRKYRMNYNDDGTVSFIDVTPYDQEGSDFGAGDINATNKAVNESFDKNKLIRDMDAINALTQEGYAPDALALKDVSDSLQNLIKVGTISGTTTSTNGALATDVLISEKIMLSANVIESDKAAALQVVISVSVDRTKYHLYIRDAENSKITNTPTTVIYTYIDR